eukprot:419505_1
MEMVMTRTVTGGAQIQMDLIQSVETDVGDEATKETIRDLQITKGKETVQHALVKQWLNTTGLHQYYQTFIAHGYESLGIVVEITEEELLEIGVDSKEHQDSYESSYKIEDK